MHPDDYIKKSIDNTAAKFIDFETIKKIGDGNFTKIY